MVAGTRKAVDSMYVRSVNVSLDNGNAYDLVVELRDCYLPQFAAQPGFLWYYAVVTGVTGTATARICTDLDRARLSDHLFISRATSRRAARRRRLADWSRSQAVISKVEGIEQRPQPFPGGES